ncbi:hypothetical protein ACHAWF_013190, partial [Thalassiosira exigua]
TFSQNRQRRQATPTNAARSQAARPQCSRNRRAGHEHEMRSRLGGVDGAPGESDPAAVLRRRPGSPDPDDDALRDTSAASASTTSSSSSSSAPPPPPPPYGYRVYRARWLMLWYLSLLNLLSDWTGLSVAPIATITSRAYTSDDDYIYAKDNDAGMYIQPEALVTVFLIASSVGTALEPWILSRLGLRRTVVFGSFFLMLGNLVKSGGLPPFFTVRSLLHGMCGTYALYLGFFLVGFAQPLFQCTPALLSASWFPEEERTLATSIALNANQLGVGLAFIVGALYVQSPSQIANYFSLLSLLSVIAFVGTALQLEDAPPTPPSGSSRIMRGTLEVSVRDIIQRASSSLLNANGGRYNYNFNADRMWGYCGDDDDGGVAASEASAASTKASASAASLLRRHVARRDPSGGPTPTPTPPPSRRHEVASSVFATPYSVEESTYFADCDDGAEPTLTQTPHRLEIDVRDDQVFVAARACLARPGFSHALVVFSASGLVINVLSTYLDYLVRGDYFAEEERASTSPGGGVSEASVYVAVIGALFQVFIMISSVAVGSFMDATRSYFSVTIVLMVLGAFALAECGVSLDTDRDGDVRWSMLLVSGLLGPLLPVATELAVELAYPLSENTVLVILQLSCNLLSALFIPLFQAVRDVGVTTEGKYDGVDDDGAARVLGDGRPPYTFSFYLLILICSVSTVYFATFDGRYLRLESEQAKKRGENHEQHQLLHSSP